MMDIFNNIKDFIIPFTSAGFGAFTGVLSATCIQNKRMRRELLKSQIENGNDALFALA